MEIKIVQPPPVVQPRMVHMTFTTTEGWAIVMALRDAHEKYRGAATRGQWLGWANQLDKELRA